jgi:hypothetical protein
LPLQTQLQDLVRQDVACLQDHVLNLGQGGAPGGAGRAPEVVGQLLGDAFEIGPQGLDSG